MDFLNTEEKRQRRLIHVPMGRFGEAIEIAQAALFRAYSAIYFLQLFFSDNNFLVHAVASDESSYVTVRVDVPITRKC
jgi:NAD(P)-dependent dehydrogenase (short-subunit alcohol dehydrogenase family)